MSNYSKFFIILYQTSRAQMSFFFLFSAPKILQPSAHANKPQRAFAPHPQPHYDLNGIRPNIAPNSKLSNAS